jgi:chromosomal replication initiation ATPase DnaA
MKEHIFNKFIDNILKHTGLSREDFFSKSQNGEIVLARQTLFYLCSKRGLTTAMIRQYMENNECHLTRPPITYGVSIVEGLLKEDSDLQNVIDKLSVVD